MATFIYPQIDISDQILADIEQNTADTATNTGNIDTNTANIDTNTANIDTNTANAVTELQNIITALSDNSQTTQIVDGSGNVIGSTSNALDIFLTNSTLPLPTGAATETTLADIKTAVELIDNAVSGNELQVDVVSSALPTGAATETTLDAIKTAVELLDNAVSGNELQVDVVSSALPTGAATETTLADIKTAVELLDNTVSGNELQVDVVSSALPTGAATEATLGDIKTSVQLLDNAVSGNELQVDVKSIEGIQDANNTTTTLLGANGVYTGTWTDLTNWNGINVGVYADVDSATDGLRVEYSNDATNIHHSHSFTVGAGGVGYGYNLSAEFKYYRLKYTNNSVAQATFVLSAMLKPTATFPSTYKITAPLTDNSQALQTRSVITGYSTAGGGQYVNVKVNPSGALAADVSGTVAATQSGTWNINNISGTVSLPTGAATEATLADIKTSAQLLDNAISGNEMQVDVVTSALPTGAATSAAQTDGSQKSQIVSSGGTSVSLTGTYLDVNLASGSVTATNSANGATGSAVPSDATLVGGTDSGTLRAIKVSSTGVVSVDGSAVTQPISAASLPLPTDAATQTTLSALNNKVPSNLTVSSTRLLVDGSGVTQPVAQAGRSKANTPVFNDYSSTNVTTSAYVQLVASTTSACTAVEVYNQCASSIYFATGAAASEVNQFIIPPGGNGLLPISIASSTRIAVKAVDSSATSGSLIINFWS